MGTIAQDKSLDPCVSRRAVAERLGFYDFFAGVGLAGLGLGDAWQCLWANDFDPGKGEIYDKNFGPGLILIEDVSEVRARKLPGSPDLAWASFPCQDLSLAGWQRGMTAKRSGAFWEFWRIIRELQTGARNPRILVIENVVGLLYGDNFVGLCEAIASLGYRFGALIMDAKRFVAQSRQRVFLIAVDSRVDTTGFTLSRPPVRSVWYPKKLRNSINGLDDELKSMWVWWKLPTPARRKHSLSKVVTEPDEHDPSWFSEGQIDHLLSLMAERHRKKVEDAKAYTGKPKIMTVYKRRRKGYQRAEVRDDGISGCLRVPGGGSSRQTVLFAGNGQIRARLMNRRELANLMGAPDSFWLPEQYNAAYQAMGDAVVVPVVSWLSDNLLTPLARRIRQSDESAPLDPESLVRYMDRSLNRVGQWKKNES